MGVLVVDNVIAGTGCFDNNHITGVYVLPSHQKQGCGTQIMNCLENEMQNAVKTSGALFMAKYVCQCLYQSDYITQISKEHILDGIMSGNMGVLVVDNVIAGTGCLENLCFSLCRIPFLSVKKYQV